jgi:predicted DNA-binding transcriptional regulator AlpA
MSENNIAFWRFKELRKHVPYGRTTIWKMYTEGTFPKPYKIGKNVIAWRSDEVLAWMEARERA